MTDRIHALTVVLHEDMRDDEIGPLLTAISLLSPVVDVRPHVSGSLDEHVGATRADAAWRRGLLGLMRERAG